MRWSEFGRGRSFGFALAACVALAVPAAAEDAAPLPGADSGTHGPVATPDSPPPVPEPKPKPKLVVTIPVINTVNSSVDEATLRSIFSGDLVSHAEALATLRATSIDIPELRIGYAMPEIAGQAEVGDVVLRDISLNRISNGIAQAVTIGGTETASTKGGVAKFGRMSAEDFDIGGLLAFYGLVKLDPMPTTPRTIYRKLVMSGGTVTAPDITCTIGGARVALFKARPPKVPFTDLIAIAGDVEKEREKPSPETIATLIDFYVDIFSAVEVSPIAFDGFDCSGKDSDGKPIAIKVGPVSFGAFNGDGRYPEFTARDMKIVAEGDGEMSLGEIRFKGFDLSGTLATLKGAGAALDEAWFEEHYRQLLPTFDGFAFSDLSIDVPNEDKPGERIKATVSQFDLTLKDYINGIPSSISTLGAHIVAALPTDTDEDTLKRLLDLGIENFDISYDLALKWDEASNEVRLDRFSLSGVDMGSIAVASVIGQATRDLFSTDVQTALAAAMGMTLKRVKIDVQDSGLADVILESAAKEAGKEVGEFRRALAGLTQGTMLIFLGGAANATDVVKAVGDFLNGAKSLSINVTAKNPAGIDFQELNALKEDPTALTEKVTIEAVAK